MSAHQHQHAEACAGLPHSTSDHWHDGDEIQSVSVEADRGTIEIIHTIDMGDEELPENVVLMMPTDLAVSMARRILAAAGEGATQ